MAVDREHAAGSVAERLIEGRSAARKPSRRGGAAALFALQRAAGNSAVSALMAGKLKSSGDSVSDIDGALREVRGDEPNLEIVEKGLKATKAAGVPVDLEGEANKPPATALAVVKTGFGPAVVAPKKPVPPPKPTKPVSPLGKAGAKAPKPAGGATKAPAAKAPGAGGGGGGALPMAPAPLSKDKLLQPPVAPTGTQPGQDPAFAQVKGNVKGFAKAKKDHPPAASKAKEAQDAALPPTDDVAGQAKAAKVDTMDAQPAGTFDKKAFIAAVKTAIEAKSPKTLKEADNYKESGKAGEVKGEVKGMVTDGKEGSAKDIEGATEAAPDESKAVPKEVTPLAQEDPGKVAAIPAAGAVPKPVPAEQVNLEAGKHEANQEMADANVSEEQLAKSNEPEFQGALADKKKAAEHADSAPGEYRQAEKETIAQGKEQAGAETTAGVAGMQGAKGAALAKLVAAKGKTKSKDEAKRAEVTTKIQSIFAATEADVKKILDGIDPKVDKEFETGEAAAKAKFETYVAAKMSAYKKDRYGGWLGGLRWAKDKLLGMPDKVNEFYEAGRELYLKEMDGVISRVADIVGGDLTAAKQRIAKGRDEISAYVKTLSPDLQKVGNEAAQEIGEKFEQLESDVNDKQNEVVETLASKYVEARKGLDERIEALQAENKGLVDKAIGAIKAVINTIRELASMLKNALARAASVIGDIIGDPIGFLGNLISGIKGGIDKFFGNIGAHLKKGLMGWLFGQLANAGIELPETFDLKGIIKLLASIFGLTWANIKNRIIMQIGKKAMDAIEAGVDIFQKLASQGVAGLWEMLLEKLGNIKDMIMEQVEDFVLTKIITAGITWLISLLNPAAAFIKACKLIYDVVMFFVTNASRIAKFVNTVIDGVVDIAKGNVSAVVAKIEDALSQMVPILIGFIASVLGIGGIGEKIRSIIQKLQKPVMKAVDFVIKTGLKLAAPIIRGLKGIGAKAKAKIASGKAYVKGKVDAGKAYVKGKAAAAKQKVTDRLRGRDPKPAELATAAAEADALMTRPGATREQVAGELPGIKSRFGLSKAALVTETDGEVHVTIQRAKVNTPSHLIGKSLTEAEIHTRIREIANAMLKDKGLKARVQAILEAREEGLGETEEEPRKGEPPGVEAAARIEHGRPAGQVEHIERAGVVVTERQTRSSKPGHIHVLGLGESGKYDPDIKNAIRGIKKRTGATDAQIAAAVRSAGEGRMPGAPINKDQGAVAYMFRLAQLEAVEASRNPSHVITSSMAHDVVEGGGATAQEMVTELNPMYVRGAGGAARGVSARVDVEHPGPAKSVGTREKVDAFIKQELAVAVAWVETYLKGKHGEFSEKRLVEFVKNELIGRLEAIAKKAAGAVSKKAKGSK